MAQFTLKIKLGNEAMQTGNDLAYALKSVSSKIEDNYDKIKNESGKIMDLNGNTVGSWSVR